MWHVSGSMDLVDNEDGTMSVVVHSDGHTVSADLSWGEALTLRMATGEWVLANANSRTLPLSAEGG